MPKSLHELPPKARLLFYKGYLQALEDLSDQATERACKVQSQIDKILTTISHEGSES